MISLVDIGAGIWLVGDTVSRKRSEYRASW